MNDKQKKVLNIVRGSSTGLTEQQLAEKALVEGVTSIQPEVKALEGEGLLRRDQYPAPARVKATPAGFEVAA